jgi:hypothetical protein
MKKIYRTKTSTQSGYPSTHSINHSACVLRVWLRVLFDAWQDLALEATGHDTEWGYPIAIDRLTQVLQIPEEVLTVLLTKLTQPELELCSDNTAMTFHYPPGEDEPFDHQELSSIYLFNSSLAEPFRVSKTQLIEANSIAA